MPGRARIIEIEVHLNYKVYDMVRQSGIARLECGGNNMQMHVVYIYISRYIITIANGLPKTLRRIYQYQYQYQLQISLLVTTTY
jgi:hypothetical protein